MKTIILAAIMGLLCSTPAAAGMDENLFKDLQCIKCHTVNSRSIPTTSKKDPEEIKDLSNTGNLRDEQWLIAYMKKEQELNGKKHKMKFKGTEEQMKQIVAMLLTLKM